MTNIKGIMTLILVYFSLAEGSTSKVLVVPFGLFKNTAQAMLEKLAVFLQDNPQYEVHMLVYKEYDSSKMKGIQMIHFDRPAGIDENSVLTFSLEEYLNIDHLGFFMWIYEMSRKTCKSILSDEDLMYKLLQNSYDLFVYDSVDMCSTILGNYLDVPSIGLVQFAAQIKLRQQENPYPLSYLPMATYMPPMSFTQRVINVLISIPANVITTYLMREECNIGSEFNITVAPLDSLYFHYGGHPFQIISPTLPDMVYTDDFFISKPKGIPFTADIDQFVTGSGEHGIIVFTFGSMISDFGETYGEMFADSLAGLPQRVLWRYTGTPPKNLPSNVKLVSWMPQPDLLAHPKTKLLITHGGLNSMHEALYNGVPMIVCPMNADQFINAAIISDYLKVGEHVNLKTVNSSQLLTVIMDVLRKPVYKEQAQTLSKQFRDKPVTSEKHVLFWVDYVIRHKGVNHLRPYGAQLPWYQFYLLDVIVFLLCLVTTVIFAIYWLCIFCITKCCRLTKKVMKTD